MYNKMVPSPLKESHLPDPLQYCLCVAPAMKVNWSTQRKEVTSASPPALKILQCLATACESWKLHRPVDSGGLQDAYYLGQGSLRDCRLDFLFAFCLSLFSRGRRCSPPLSHTTVQRGSEACHANGLSSPLLLSLPLARTADQWRTQRGEAVRCAQRPLPRLSWPCS